jgi:septal ring factor EnvC (AmiA/AmiB activator)
MSGVSWAVTRRRHRLRNRSNFSATPTAASSGACSADVDAAAFRQAAPQPVTGALAQTFGAITAAATAAVIVAAS